MTKTCSKCGVEKHIEDFSLKYDKRYPADRRMAACKKCKNFYRVQRNRRDGYERPKSPKVYGRRANLKKYGLTLDDYDRMLEHQSGGCALCSKPMPDEDSGHVRLHVDHCHQTGVIRGLLCMRCNTALGALGDTLERLEAVVEYLRDPPAQDLHLGSP